MEIETAQRIVEGKEQLTGKESLNELMQLKTGACFTDEGEIWCLQCGQPNECCTCT